LVLAAVVRLVVSVADPGTVERDPYHLHLVIGGTPAQRADALAHHRHHGHDRLHRPAEPLGRDGADAARPRGEPPGGPDAPRVVSLFPGSVPGAMVLSAAGLALATAAAANPTAPPMTGQVARPERPRVARVVLPVPDPPPRADLPT
jgi:hypothetical protein